MKRRRLLRSYRAVRRAQVHARDLLHHKKRRGGAVFEIPECEDPGAQLRERAALGQCQTADLLRRLFFASGFDLAPVVLGIPFAVRPMLHLVSSFCLHHVPRSFVRRAGYKSFLATIGRHAGTIVTSQAAFALQLCAARKERSVGRATLAPAVVNGSLTPPKSVPPPCPAPAPLPGACGSHRPHTSRLRPGQLAEIF